MKFSKADLRKAIREKCKDCCGNVDARARIKYCDIDTCKLWPVRPYQTSVVKPPE